MVKLQVTFNLVNSLDNISDDLILDWLKYKLGQTSHLSCNSFLSDADIRASNVSMKLIYGGD